MEAEWRFTPNLTSVVKGANPRQKLWVLAGPEAGGDSLPMMMAGRKFRGVMPHSPTLLPHLKFNIATVLIKHKTRAGG